jgi:hypothetical protein
MNQDNIDLIEICYKVGELKPLPFLYVLFFFLVEIDWSWKDIVAGNHKTLALLNIYTRLTQFKTL